MAWRERVLQTIGPGILAGVTFGDWVRLLRENRFATVKKSPSAIRRIMATCADRSKALPWTASRADCSSMVIALANRRRFRWSGRRTSRNSLARQATILVTSRFVVGR